MFFESLLQQKKQLTILRFDMQDGRESIHLNDCTYRSAVRVSAILLITMAQYYERPVVRLIEDVQACYADTIGVKSDSTKIDISADRTMIRRMMVVGTYDDVLPAAVLLIKCLAVHFHRESTVADTLRLLRKYAFVSELT